MKTYVKALPLTALLVLTACPTAIKSAGDAAKTIQCVADDWGKPAEQIAADCFSNILNDALDAIAAAEVLLQKNGSKPTPAYLTDARVQQRVLAAMAPKAPPAP